MYAQAGLSAAAQPPCARQRYVGSMGCIRLTDQTLPPHSTIRAALRVCRYVERQTGYENTARVPSDVVVSVLRVVQSIVRALSMCTWATGGQAPHGTDPLHMEWKMSPMPSEERAPRTTRRKSAVASGKVPLWCSHRRLCSLTPRPRADIIPFSANSAGTVSGPSPVTR